jgi:hypothetical protein
MATLALAGARAGAHICAALARTLRKAGRHRSRDTITPFVIKSLALFGAGSIPAI